MKTQPYMKDLNRFHPKILFLSYFGSGFSPYAPGTVGSILAIPLLLTLHICKLPLWILFFCYFVGTTLSIFVADEIQKKHNLHDPSWIVIDEVIGMATAWFFLSRVTPLTIIVLLVLFRFFDIIKIWPANFFDKQIKHGAGTILDDIISGLYAGIIIRILILFFPAHF